MNAPIDDDKAFEEYLQRGSAVSQRYRALDADDVPSELDRQILQRAAEAVRPAGNRARTWRRWSVPVALAASTVLAVSIVLESGVMESEAPTAQMTRELPAVPSGPASAAQEPVQELAQEQAPAPQGPADVSTSSEQVREVAPAAPREPAVVTGARVRVPEVQSPRASKKAEEREQVAATRTEQSAERADAPAAFAPAPPPPAAVPYEPDRSRAQAASRSEPRSAMPMSPMPVAQRQVAPLPDLTSMEKAASAPAGLATSSAPLGASELERREFSEPEPWLEYIRALRDEGKIEQADAEWQRFRDEYPDYSVADDDHARPRE